MLLLLLILQVKTSGRKHERVIRVTIMGLMTGSEPVPEIWPAMVRSSPCKRSTGTASELLNHGSEIGGIRVEQGSRGSPRSP